MNTGGRSAGSPTEVDRNEVRRALDKILGSQTFVGALRAQQFLRFVVEESLAGRSHEIKEVLVATRVFQLDQSFDRRKNSIVRAEATRLRKRLKEYYAREGRRDSLIIELPSGGYAAGFHASPWRRRLLAIVLGKIRSVWLGV